MDDSAILKAQKNLVKGPVTNNGLVNFMRHYAAGCPSFDVPDVVKGGQAWNRLSTVQREKYRYQDAGGNEDFGYASCSKTPSCPKKRRRSCPKPSCPMRRKPRCSKPRCSKPRCSKPRCSKPRKSCGRMKYKCQSPGPVTNNGYLNFLRSYRRKHCGLSPNELVIKAARAWCRLPEHKKDRYRRQACKMTQSCRHKSRRVCDDK